MPASTNSVSSGSSVTWIGTICSANTTTNRKSRPGNFTQAKMYAASDASTSGITTDGITMTKELTKYGPSADCPSAASTVS
jgi:hypothetical protein